MEAPLARYTDPTGQRNDFALDEDERFATSTSPVNEVEVRPLLAEVWGLHGRLRLLGGERDSNFQILATDGAIHLLKVAHPAESEAELAFQIAALRHLEQAEATLPVSRVISTASGDDIVCRAFSGGARRCCYVLSFPRGVSLEQADGGLEQRRSVGAALAWLDRVLAGFSHLGEDGQLPWDLQRADALRPALSAVLDLGIRRLAQDVFDGQVARRLRVLRKQVIHSDLNPRNVPVVRLEPARIAGLIDVPAGGPSSQRGGLHPAERAGCGSPPVGARAPVRRRGGRPERYPASRGSPEWLTACA